MKITITKLLVMILPLLVAACSNTPAQEQVQKINNQKLNELMAEGDVQLLDVRTPEEVSFGIIEGATVVDYYDPVFADKVSSKLDTSKLVVVYCAAGGRSARATDQLKEMGFKVIYDLSGGFRGWQAAGNPVKKSN